MKLAVSGKGGVGKTTFSALLIRTLNQSGKQVLAIDADTDGIRGLVFTEAVNAAVENHAGDEPLEVVLPRRGQGLIEIVDIENQSTFRTGIATEIEDVRITASLDIHPRGGRAGQIPRHDGRCPAVETERRLRHPAIPDRHQLLDPTGLLRP